VHNQQRFKYTKTNLNPEIKNYVGVGFEVGKKVEDDLDTLLWPSTLDDTEFLSLGASTGGSSESSEWNTSLVVEDLSKVLLGSLDGHTLKNSSGVIGVLERSSNVTSLGENG
jgi:hypothetical protein